MRFIWDRGLRTKLLGGFSVVIVFTIAVAAVYRGLIDLMVIDEQDRALAPRVEALGMRCHVTDTMMTSAERKAELAAEVVREARRVPRAMGR